MHHADPYVTLLRDPPDHARGATRWWWFGAAVTDAGIRRQLQAMADAHLGAVELQVMYALHEDDPSLGLENAPFLSQPFFARVRSAAETARALGLAFDVTPGSSWPYGGPVVPAELAPKIAIPYQRDIKGPTVYDEDFTTVLPGTVERAVIGRVLPGGALDPDSLRDVSAHLEPTHLHGWRWGTALRDVVVPEGHWRVTLWVVAEHRQRVGKPAPGADGYALDHTSAAATDLYLRSVASAFLDELPGLVRDVFCDSIELAGNNWSDDMLAAFQDRCGYDLTPWLPALWQDAGPHTADVRVDYFRTFGDLTLERFFEPLGAWARDRGVRSRIQAHGTWADVLRAYAAADVPEGETFGAYDHFAVNVVHRRLAASAAHVYGRPIVSNETFTWLRSPRFLVTLEMMRRAVDAAFLDGVNQVVNHGYAYAEDGWDAPGWVFYASSVISHVNPWWRWYGAFGRYVQRASAFLRQGASVADVAVYLPQDDVRASTPLAELHMGMQLGDRLGALPDALARAGHAFDLLNDEALTDLAIVDGAALALGAARYRAVVLPRTSRMPLATLCALAGFVERGGTLVVAGEPPRSASGMREAREHADAFAETATALFGPPAPRPQVGERRRGAGSVVYVADEPAAALSGLAERCPPRVAIDADGVDHDEIGRNLGLACRVAPRPSAGDPLEGARRGGERSPWRLDTDGWDDLVFVAHGAVPAGLDGVRRVRLTPREPRAWWTVVDLADGVVVYEGPPLADGLVAWLPAHTSWAWVLRDAAPDGAAGVDRRPGPPTGPRETLDVGGPWTLRVPGHDDVTLPAPMPWTELELTRWFAGEASYATTFTAPPPRPGERAVLDLGAVDVAAEVLIDGASVGMRAWAPWTLDVGEHLTGAPQRIEVRVASLLINAMLDPSRTVPTPRPSRLATWPYLGDVIDRTRAERLDPLPEREALAGPLPSGLHGPVRVRYVTTSAPPTLPAPPEEAP